jgi:CBS domain-containing protein
VEPDESVSAAARRMADRGVGTLVVLNSAGAPAGLVTDRDLVLRVLAASRDADETKVAEVMTLEPRSVREDNSIEGAIALMRAGGFRRLPVVDGDGRLVGIVSLDDVLALLAEESAQIGALLETKRR